MGILNKKKKKALEIRLSQKIAGGLWDFFGFIFSTDILKSRQILSGIVNRHWEKTH